MKVDNMSSQQAYTKEQLAEYLKNSQCYTTTLTIEQKEIELLKKRIDWLESVIKKVKALAAIIADEGTY